MDYGSVKTYDIYAILLKTLDFYLYLHFVEGTLCIRLQFCGSHIVLDGSPGTNWTSIAD